MKEQGTLNKLKTLLADEEVWKRVLHEQKKREKAEGRMLRKKGVKGIILFPSND